ncbi:pLS20_p028 family conjugation system transmembrane protein [Leuconostoc pseudomesenteroides]|uniref:pLS20_p028 family conjugation system transmembrane protein n=1 Tax=Leuconostoc pseudomesenteroides TaxID=33968 RepID=UPI0039E8E57B
MIKQKWHQGILALTTLWISSLILIPNVAAASYDSSKVTFWDSVKNYMPVYPHLVITVLMLILHGIALLFYYLAQGVFEAYTHAFSLFDFTTIFTGHSSAAANTVAQQWGLLKIGALLFDIGFIALALMMVVQWIRFAVSNGAKGREWPKGIVISVGLIAILPWLLSIFTQIVPATASFVMNPNGQQVKNYSPIDQLWRNESVYLPDLAKNDFDYAKYVKSRDGDDAKTDKFYKQLITSSVYHNVMSDGQTDGVFGIGAKDGYATGLNDTAKKVFTQKWDYANDKVVDLDKASWATGKTFQEDYPVIKTNWLGIIGGEIVYIVVVFGAIISLFLAMYRIAMYVGTVGFFVMRDGTKGKRAQQVMQLIEGQLTGAVLLPVGLTLFFAWTQFAFDTINGLTLDMWPYTVLAIAALVAGGKGVMTGFQLIEEWTGTSTQHNAMATVMGAQMAGNIVAKGLSGGQSLIGKGVGAVTGKTKQKKVQAAMGNGADGRGVISDSKNSNPTGGLGGTSLEGLPLKKNGKVDTDRLQDGKVLPKGKSHCRNTAHIAAGVGRAGQTLAHPIKTTVSAGKAAGSGVKQAVWDKGLKQYGQNVGAGFTAGKQSINSFNSRHTKPSVGPIQTSNAQIGMGGNQAAQSLSKLNNGGQSSNQSKTKGNVSSDIQSPKPGANAVSQPAKPTVTSQNTTQLTHKVVNPAKSVEKTDKVQNSNKPTASAQSKKTGEFDIDDFAKNITKK